MRRSEMGILLKSSVAVLILLLVLLSLTCDKSPTGPEPVKDPRTYTWTIDTLAYPGSIQTTMRDIWASSPNDVYVVGHNDRGYGQMFHYDGKLWSPVNLYFPDDQGNASIDLAAVYGFNAGSIYAVGARIYDNPNPPPHFVDSSLIIRFDGQQWSEEEMEHGELLQSIWGTSPSNLLAGGYTKYLYQNDGAGWKRDSLPVVIPSDGFFQVNAIEGTPDGDVYVLANTNYNAPAKTVFYFFRRHLATWTLVDSSLAQPGYVEHKWGIGDLWVSPSGMLYSCGVGVYRWNGLGWQMLFDHPSFLAGITGTTDENIFVVGGFGAVLYFDSRDWYQYNQFIDSTIAFRKAWTDGKEVMVVGNTTASYPQKTIVLHGK